MENNNSATGLSSRIYDDEDDGESHQFSAESSGGGNQNGGSHQTMDINMTEAGRYSRPSFGRQQYVQQREAAPAVSASVADDDPQTSPADALPPVAAGRAVREERNPRNLEDGLPPPIYSRRPPTHPVLSPEFRYCPRDGIVKPMRSHHCRACGTVCSFFSFISKLTSNDWAVRFEVRSSLPLYVACLRRLFTLN